MKRRKFLTLSGIAAAVVALPAIGLVSTSVKDATAATIFNDFPYLKLDKEGVDKFVDALLIARPPTLAFKTKVRGAKLLGMKASKANLKFNVSQQYLLSTDFFRNKMDESKPVKFIGFYDPYQMPCSNPFTSLYYPPDKS